MSRAASPFSPRTLLVVLAVGAAAFLLLLYAIGAGWDESRDRNGGAHAAANGINGFAGLARLLEEQGHAVSVSRSEARLDDRGLLVITPEHGADGAEVAEIIASRRHLGPTLLILPKWFALPAEQIATVDAPQGWVVLAGAGAPEWLGEIEQLENATARLAPRKRWSGMGLAGNPADPATVLSIEAGSVISDDWATLIPLVRDDQGDLLAGYLNDDGYYPMLDAASNYTSGDDVDTSLWPVVVVADPDLMNNYALADGRRARLASAIVAATLNHGNSPITFDLTAAGLGRSQNLLTLAFEPPFLAATLCLLLVALIIAWRAFRRFGPPLARAPALLMGKRQLARNGGGLVARAKRLHLLGPPYAQLVSVRLAARLGIREADPQIRDAAIARRLVDRGLAAHYLEQADALRRARHPAELLRAACALRTIERTATP